MTWSCPLCREALSRDGHSLVCPSRHCFDVAREGYVNLLPVNRKRSREPGDNREMIEARRRVHGADLYRPLVDAMCMALLPELDAQATLLDLGCGEGYYSQGLLQAMPRATLFGVDIAKPAVRLAARGCGAGQFAVASAFDVPLPDQSLDAVFCVFAPASEGELRRLLKPAGVYLKVAPGAKHLWELRQQLYDDPRPHPAEVEEIAGLAVQASSRVRFPLKLQGDLLGDLIAMTPYAYGGLRENKEKLAALSFLEIQADFNLTLYRPQQG